MPDYVRHICPQFSRTDVNFQRVPMVDTSNPFIARAIPTLDESMLIIRFRPQGLWVRPDRVARSRAQAPGTRTEGATA